MDRHEFIRLFVLNTICDDYENIDQIILPNALRDGARCGVTMDRSEVVEALTSLVEDGLAKAYNLRREPDCCELDGMPDVSEIEEDFETYFLVTDKGKEFHRSNDSWWPFDEDDNLLPDWSLYSASASTSNA